MSEPITISTQGVFITDPGTQELHVAPGFGITAGGNAYYSPGGAAAGDAAWMKFTPAGIVKLEQPKSGMTFSLTPARIAHLAKQARRQRLAPTPKAMVGDPREKHLAAQARRARNAERMAATR